MAKTLWSSRWRTALAVALVLLLGVTAWASSRRNWWVAGPVVALPHDMGTADGLELALLDQRDKLIISARCGATNTYSSIRIATETANSGSTTYSVENTTYSRSGQELIANELNPWMELQAGEYVTLTFEVVHGDGATSSVSHTFVKGDNDQLHIGVQ